jgi:hypothetical protein
MTASQTKTRQPRFMDMTAEELREAYWHHRNAGASWAEMPTVIPGAGRRSRSRVADKVFYHQDRMDLVVNVARKRGIDLFAR